MKIFKICYNVIALFVFVKGPITQKPKLERSKCLAYNTNCLFFFLIINFYFLFSKNIFSNAMKMIHETFDFFINTKDVRLFNQNENTIIDECKDVIKVLNQFFKIKFKIF
jgi:hypothetical protein